MFSKEKELTPKVDVYIPKRVADQMKHLCKVISQVEWSGPLFYTMEGSIKDPSKCKITLQEILPLDKGSTGYTTYEIGMPVAKFMHKHNAPEKGWKMGHIHSHNTMGVFFSATDTSELKDNSENHNFYLSLIVNNKHEIIAKIGISAKYNQEDKVEEKLGYTALDESGEEYFIEEMVSRNKTMFYEYECNIIEEPAPIEVSEEFLESIEAMTEHKFASRESFKDNRWDNEDDDSIGFRRHRQYDTQKPTPKSSSHYSINSSPRMDVNIEELAHQLLANGNAEALRLSSIEDILDYHIAVNTDSEKLADDMLTRYDDLYKQIFNEEKDTYIPKLYILRNVLKAYKDLTDPATPSINNFLKPIIKAFNNKYKKI